VPPSRGSFSAASGRARGWGNLHESGARPPPPANPPMTASRIQPRSQSRTFADAHDLRWHAKVYVFFTKAVCGRQVRDKTDFRAMLFPRRAERKEAPGRSAPSRGET
jgi:hypothetical protein